MASHLSKMKAIKLLSLVIKDKNLLLSHPDVHFQLLNMLLHTVTKRLQHINFLHHHTSMSFQYNSLTQSRNFVWFVEYICHTRKHGLCMYFRILLLLKTNIALWVLLEFNAKNFSTRTSPCLFPYLEHSLFQGCPNLQEIGVHL